MFLYDHHYSDKAVNKMGLGLDEKIGRSLNLSRKNYIDYFPENPYPKDIKIVGNSLKSKKISNYIAAFLDKAIRLLVKGESQAFLDEYYSYLEKIYNYQIPLKDIASKGKVKKSINEYLEDCKTLTKAGRPKSRQAWMELAIREGLNINMGETIYYVNTGKSKSQADVKKVKHYYVLDGLFDDKKDVKTKLEKEWKKDETKGKNAGKDALAFDDWVKKMHPEVSIEEEVILNCVLIPSNIIESDEEYICKEGEEYNVQKYVDQFNKRITPLLVCFKPEIRKKILITNPNDRPYFTQEECELCCGYPNKESDQDTYEQLMTMEDKEIRFWASHPEWEIPYLKECGMNWDEILSDYNQRMERERQLGIDKVREEFNKILSNMSYDDFEEFEEGNLPKEMNKLVEMDPVTGNLISKEYHDITIATIYDILDAKEEKLNMLEFGDEIELEEI